jgi:hypothetical protein
MFAEWGLSSVWLLGLMVTYWWAGLYRLELLQESICFGLLYLLQLGPKLSLQHCSLGTLSQF